MPKDPYEIKKLLRNGVSLSVSAIDYDYYDLKRFAREALENGASLRIMDAGHLEHYEIRRINEEGEGCVSFDVTDAE